MSAYLGIDTSNYTTSVAIYDSKTDEMISLRKLLPVKEGEKGLRQSETVFYHNKALPELLSQVLQTSDIVKAIGVSDRPRNVQGSYMPCFTLGDGYAKTLSAALKLPIYKFSHQQGHIAAAIFSIKQYKLLENFFIAFHVSGGTTEALLYTPNKDDYTDFNLEIIGRTLDLNAGQLIDRTGVMLGIGFPAGKELENISKSGKLQDKPKVTLKGFDICLSGFQNKAENMFKAGIKKEDIAFYIIEAIKLSIEKMTQKILSKYGDIPLLYAGGVMSNSYVRDYFTKKYNAYFAKPEFSSDNAAGISFLTYLKEEKVIGL